MNADRTAFRDAQHVRDWSVSHGSGFWVGRSRALKFWTWSLHLVLPVCYDPVPPNLTLVDVGAGIHGLQRELMTTNRLHSDDSDALLFLWTFHDNATVYAYEANADKSKELTLAAAARHTTSAYAAHLHVRTQAVGKTQREVVFERCGYISNYQVAADWAPPASVCKHTDRVWQTTLDDDFPPEDKHGPFILYVKVDVEAGTPDALAGMTTRLEVHHTPLVSVEYAYQWSPEFYKRAAVPLEARANLAHSLDATQRWLDALGYDVFLLHAQGSGRVVTLVPVTGRFWHPDMEVCANRSLFYGNWGSWCWNDILVVSRAPQHACVREWMYTHFVGAPAADRADRAERRSTLRVL